MMKKRSVKKNYVGLIEPNVSVMKMASLILKLFEQQIFSVGATTYPRRANKYIRMCCVIMCVANILHDCCCFIFSEIHALVGVGRSTTLAVTGVKSS